MQSHLSESNDEVAFAVQEHGQRDAATFAQHDLLAGAVRHRPHLPRSYRKQYTSPRRPFNIENSFRNILNASPNP